MSQTSPKSAGTELPEPSFEKLADAIFKTAEAAKAKVGVLDARALYKAALSPQNQDTEIKGEDTK